MRLKLVMLNESHAKEICDWKYEGIYSAYNLPEWDTIVKNNWGITNEEIRQNEFVAVVDQFNNLCGHIRFKESNNEVFIGIGLNPSLCGQGLGNELMILLKDECRRRYGDKKIALEVRTFNKRAIKCYEKAGFNMVSTYNKCINGIHGEFVRMEHLF